jgi:hypothetical protein
MKWVELTGLDDLPVLIALEHVVTVTPAAPGGHANARTLIETVAGNFAVQQTYDMVCKVFGEEGKH